MRKRSAAVASPEFARELVLEAEAWVEEGVVSRAQADALRSRYATVLSQPGRYVPTPRAGDRASGGLLAEFLYALAGVLVGAAALVVLVVGLATEEPAAFAIVGAALIAAGLIVHLRWERRLVGDALLAAGLVPLTMASFPGGDDLYGALAMVAAVALLLWRRDVTFLPSLAVVAFTIGAAATFFELFERGEDLAWFLAQTALLVGVVAGDRMLRGADSALAAALAVGAVAIPFTLLLDEQASMTSELAEISLGGLMLGALAVGVWLRHRGVAVGSAIVLGGDAVVFAFDVGGVLLGTGILLALAGVLVWQAEFLKRYLRS